jgi:hypothetical protein
MHSPLHFRSVGICPPKRWLSSLRRRSISIVLAILAEADWANQGSCLIVYVDVLDADELRAAAAKAS